MVSQAPRASLHVGHLPPVPCVRQRTGVRLRAPERAAGERQARLLHASTGGHLTVRELAPVGLRLSYSVAMPHQLKVTLEGIEPPVWRRLVVPSDFTLYDLHYVIQVAMGWEDCHLHDFTIKRQRYVVPGSDDFGDPADETKARLRDVAGPRSKIVYQYDFGDSWNHVIVVEKVLESADGPLPSCIAGARACPPEDSGGAWGYEDKLQALANSDDEDGEELREWMGEDFDPEQFEVTVVNRQLLAAFRPAPSRKKKRKG